MSPTTQQTYQELEMLQREKGKPCVSIIRGEISFTHDKTTWSPQGRSHPCHSSDPYSFRR
jgi:hypothetical protein